MADTALRDLRARAVSHSTDPPAVVLDYIYAKLPIEVQVLLGCPAYLKRQIRRWRDGDKIPDPKSMAELELHSTWTHLGNGESFVFIDNACDSNRIIAFSTELNMKVSTVK